jgi:hypothetical protein
MIFTPAEDELLALGLQKWVGVLGEGWEGVGGALFHN